MKHYTLKQAQKEISNSTDYKLAKRVSIKKWKEIVKYGQRYYGIGDECGFCLVSRNILFEKGMRAFGCRVCPQNGKICDDRIEDEMTKITMKEILKELRSKK